VRRRDRAPLVGRHPLLDGPPTRRPRPGGAVALLAVLAVVLAVWAVSGGDPGTATRTDDRYDEVGTGSVTPTPAPTTTPTATPTATPTVTPGTPGAAAAPGEVVPVVAVRDAPWEARAALQRVCGDGADATGYRDWAFPNGRALLPAEPAGYYRAYAVPLHGPDGIGHLVVGRRDELYWTEDVGLTFVGLAR